MTPARRRSARAAGRSTHRAPSARAPARGRSPRPGPRARHHAFALAAGLVLAAVLCDVASPAAANRAEDDAGAAHRAGLRTGTLRFPLPGVLLVWFGAEYLPVVDNDLAGVRGDLLRLPTVGLRLGLGRRAMFQVDWPAYNRLGVHAQEDPPPLGRRLGPVSTDWGDVTLGTHLRLCADRGARPACGLRVAVRLPTTNEELAIGDNATDVFASVLADKSLAPGLSLGTEVGVGILTERTRTFAQNDVLTYGALLDWRARARLHVVAEAAGHVSTRTGVPGTGSRGELRAGLELDLGAVHWTALAVHGLNRQRSRGLGVSLQASTAVTVLPRESAP